LLAQLHRNITSLLYVNHHAVANGMPFARARLGNTAAKRESGPGKPWVTSFSRKLEWTYVENPESIGEGSFGIVRTATYVPSSPLRVCAGSTT
jgi:hypothetical protein